MFFDLLVFEAHFEWKNECRAAQAVGSSQIVVVTLARMLVVER
jgi:hypothetical protein